MSEERSRSILIFLALALLDAFVWYEIAAHRPPTAASLAMLDVGQGDSTLLVLPGGVKILTDAGPDGRIVYALEKVLPWADRYVDLGIISHPQLDHFGGFSELMRRYRFGALIVNGRDAEIPAWRALIAEARRRTIPLIVLGAGDRIRHGESIIHILSPDASWAESSELNDTGIVELITTPQFRALLTADIGTNVEEYLRERFDLQAHILKVGHHGSKFSSGSAFLGSVRPRIAILGVGAGNRYGHPTEEALSRLRAADAELFRTDTDGTIRIAGGGGTLKVFVSEERLLSPP